MEFEHILVVNDPDQPDIPLLTSEDVWFGLLCRAEDPVAFLPGLERCEIIEREEQRLVRDLYFGQMRVRDHVTLQPLQSICFEAQASEQHPGGRLTISLENPAPQVMTLRFRYETSLDQANIADAANPEEAAKIVEYIRSAYYNSDLDTLKRIRLIAQQRSRAQ